MRSKNQKQKNTTNTTSTTASYRKEAHMTDNKRINGTIKAIDHENKYGFIRADDGNEYKITGVGYGQTQSPETVLKKQARVSFSPFEHNYGGKHSLFANHIEPAA